MATFQNIFLCVLLWLVVANTTDGQKINFGRPTNSGSKSNRTPAPPRPPPGFAADGTANREDSPQEAAVAGFAPEFETKWVYCDNNWRQVTVYDCPIAFANDPDFSAHRSFCSPQGPLSDYPYDGTHMWLFDPSGNPNTLFSFCDNTLPCFCQACYE